MKTLFILRHAKSSWENAALADFERPLNPRGLEAAAFMGNLIRENQIQPDVILSSPAKRAKQTALLIKETAKLEKEIRYEEKIYEASPLILLKIISKIENENETALLVGHNPGLEGLIKLLTGENQAMPTAGFAKINLQIEDWNDAAPDCAQQEFFVSPKNEMKTSTVG